MTVEQLQTIMAVLEQAKRDAETVYWEFVEKNDEPLDTSDIDEAIAIVQAEMLCISN